ncbi:translin-associated factor X-interacting protein 1 isoform X2 [Callorhinchus milii]|uniref:translin-associated factor X-interacting protein 1 isoform X2 n=1 Tax=Callorhinchus milii TaxID=7868 RepID=UPI001C3F6065|nr:translin-associated factor X-interacting protein 1 isoform X2 [Callorhinchus milii]
MSTPKTGCLVLEGDSLTKSSEVDNPFTCPISNDESGGVDCTDAFYKCAPKLTCPNYHLQDCKVKYYLPEKDVMPSGDYCSAYLSAWPAHMTGKIVRSIRKPKSSGIPKHHGYDDEFASNAAKPQFLEQLEAHLRKELQTLDMSKPKIQEVKLQAYREVFEYFIEDLKTYKPLLAAIKNEYELTLAYMEDQIRELQPLKAMMFTTVEQCNQKIMAIYEQESLELKTLKDEKLDLLKQIDKSMETKNTLREQVAKLQTELQIQYKKYRDEYDARRLLLSDINNLRAQQEESKPSELQADIVEDTVKLNLALKVTRQDLTMLQVELNTMKAEYGDVIPRREFEILEKNYNELHEKHEHIQKDHNQIKVEYSTLLEVHKYITIQRDKLLLEIEQFKTSASVSGAIVPAESQEPSQIMHEIEKKETEDLEEFEGLGTGEDVLLFLRHDGLVKNTQMSRKDIVSVVMEIWKEKIQADEEVDESMYHGQVQLISNLAKQMTWHDNTNEGFLSKINFSHLLKNTFPNKTVEYLDELLQAAEFQLGADENLNYKALFGENEEEKPGPFIMLLKNQQESEKIQYVDELKSKLEEAVDVTVADLKNAFQDIDPSILPHILDTYIMYAFQTTKEQIDQAGPLDLDVLLERLQVCDVKRIGPPSIE